MPISSFLVRALLPSAAAAAATFQNGVYQFPLQQIPNHGYGVQCAVGTPPQIVTVPVDTGSSILTLPSSSSCKDNKICSGYGSYDGTTSSTGKPHVGAGGLILKGVETLLTDVVHVGDLLITGLVFGLLEHGSHGSGSASYPSPASGSQPAYALPPASGSQPAYALPPAYVPPPASYSQPAYAPPPASSDPAAYAQPAYALPPASGSQPAYALPPASGSQPAYAPPASSPSYTQPSSPSSYTPPNSYAPASQQPGHLGLGLACFDKKCQGAPSFLQQLYDLKKISSRSFSLIFVEIAKETKAAGSLIIGGYDEAKQLGQVVEVELVDPAKTALQNAAANVVRVVTITFKTIESDGKTYSTKPYSYPAATYMPLDTSYPFWSVPQELYGPIARHFGVQNPDPAGNFPVDCKYQAVSKDTLIMDFGNGSTVPVLLHKLVTKAEDGTCRVPITSQGQTLGFAYLKQLHSIFNYDNKTVKFSGVNDTTKSKIVKI